MATVVREVTLTELRERTAGVVAAVVRGEVAVISRHGVAQAILLPLGDRGSPAPVELDEKAVARLANALERRAFHRDMAKILHGRYERR